MPQPPVARGSAEVAVEPGDDLIVEYWDGTGWIEFNDYELARTIGVIALALILFTDMRLSLALLIGGFGMVMSGVLSMDEAYRSVSWKTVFLLAALIPLGDAVQESGTAGWRATPGAGWLRSRRP